MLETARSLRTTSATEKSKCPPVLFLESSMVFLSAIVETKQFALDEAASIPTSIAKVQR